MKIFISWSGPLSRAVATELQVWLRRVIQVTRPWMSEDITTGSIWFNGISENIEESKFGILCVTQMNQTAPWLLWEAGALFRGFDNGRQCVVPLLIDLDKSDLGAPLDKFQAVSATNREEILKMLSDINEVAGDAIANDDLDYQLGLTWDVWRDSVDSAIKRVPDIAASGDVCRYTFKDAAEKFILEKGIERYEYALRWPRFYIDSMLLDQVNNRSLSQFIEDRRAGTIPVPDGEKPPRPAMPATINKDLMVVGGVLNAAKRWGWIEHAPRIGKVPLKVTKKSYPLTWDEQDRIFGGLPERMLAPALFAVNTGVRKSVIRDLEWAWLTQIPGLDISAFVVPEGYYRSGPGQTILLNSIAEKVVNDQQEKSQDRYVFAGKKGGQFSFGRAFRDSWFKAGLPADSRYSKGPDNLRWTFEQRLKDVGVVREDRDYLLRKSAAAAEYADRPPDYQHLLSCLEKIARRPDGGGGTWS